MSQATPLPVLEMVTVTCPQGAYIPAQEDKETNEKMHHMSAGIKFKDEKPRSTHRIGGVDGAA